MTFSTVVEFERRFYNAALPIGDFSNNFYNATSYTFRNCIFYELYHEIIRVLRNRKWKFGFYLTLPLLFSPLLPKPALSRFITLKLESYKYRYVLFAIVSTSISSMMAKILVSVLCLLFATIAKVLRTVLGDCYPLKGV